LAQVNVGRATAFRCPTF